jgi:hypothetical protein
MCYSAAPSTTNQNATQRIYIKDIKWLGNPYGHTVLRCSMKMYLKVIGGVHVILAFLVLLLLLLKVVRTRLLQGGSVQKPGVYVQKPESSRV